MPKGTYKGSIVEDEGQSTDTLVCVRRKPDAEVWKPSASEIVAGGKLEEDRMRSNAALMELKADGVLPLPRQQYIHPPPDFLVAEFERMMNRRGEERYQYMENLLAKLEDYHQEDYIRMLCSCSSAELSSVAVQLETRSIQLSLKEAIEMQRVGALNVLGKSCKR